MPYAIYDDDDSKTKVYRFDDTHNFCIEHFFIRGHLDKLSGTCSVSLGFELIHSDIRVFHSTGSFHSDDYIFTRKTIFHSDDDHIFSRKTIFYLIDQFSLDLLLNRPFTRSVGFHSTFYSIDRFSLDLLLDRWVFTRPFTRSVGFHSTFYSIVRFSLDL